MLPAGSTYGRDLDGDGDVDVVVVGTRGGGTAGPARTRTAILPRTSSR